MEDCGFEGRLEGLLSQDVSAGTEAFRDALLERCLSALDADGGEAELDDGALELLAAAGDATARDLVLMKYLLGCRNVDIASELGMNASTVATKLAGALAKMRTVAE